MQCIRCKTTCREKVCSDCYEIWCRKMKKLREIAPTLAKWVEEAGPGGTLDFNGLCEDLKK